MRWVDRGAGTFGLPSVQQLHLPSENPSCRGRDLLCLTCWMLLELNAGAVSEPQQSASLSLP